MWCVVYFVYVLGLGVLVYCCGNVVYLLGLVGVEFEMVWCFVDLVLVLVFGDVVVFFV